MDNFAALLDMVRKSAVAILIYPGRDTDIDMKFAVELGVAVALGKRMILAVRPGTRVADTLVSICERIAGVRQVLAVPTGFESRLQHWRWCGWCRSGHRVRFPTLPFFSCK